MRLDFETILGILFFVLFVILPAFGKRRKPEGEEAAPGPRPATPSAGHERTARQGGEAPSRPAQASTSQGGTHRTPPQSRGPARAGSAEEALDEIRARVRAAQLQEDARRAALDARRAGADPRHAAPGGATGAPQQRSGTLVSGDPFGRGLTSAEGSSIMGAGGAPSPAGGLGREGGSPPRQATAPQSATRPAVVGGLGREGAVAAPLQVTRQRRERQQQGTDVTRRRPRAALDPLQLGARTGARLHGPVLATDRKALVSGMIWHEILSEPAAKRRLRRTRSRPR